MRRWMTQGIACCAVVVGACEGLARGADVCSEDQPLAEIGGVAIAWKDVRQAQGQVRVLGGELGDRNALIDVLWQEHARQEAGLPGGTEIFRSRREVVRRYKRAGDARSNGEQVEQPEFRAGELPKQARLTECGTLIMAGQDEQ